MLKKRIIPIQLLHEERLVKSAQFDKFRDVGDPVASSRVYNSQNADELIFLNISRENEGIGCLLEILDKVSKVCFMPLSLGGGIRTYEQAAQLIRGGADKVVVNSLCYEDDREITKIAEKFGSQAVVVAIDVRRTSEIDYQLYSHCGQKQENIDLESHIKRCVAVGAGEILIQSIDCDGMMGGFDIALLKRVQKCSTVPVIACGGSGDYSHLRDVFLSSDVSAVACGSIFNFSDSNLIRAKAFLSNYDLPFKSV